MGCYVCGNMQDIPRDENGKPLRFGQPALSPKEQTRAISTSCSLKTGKTYRFSVQITPKRTKQFVGVLMFMAGPMCRFTIDGEPRDFHSLEIKAVEEVN